MKSVRVVQSDWGGKAHEIAGALELYGYKFTVETVRSGAHLRRLCEEAIAKPKCPTLVLLSEGLTNQFGKKIRDNVLPEAGGLKVIWIGVPTPRGYDAPPNRRVAEDGLIDEAALLALGETTQRRRDVLAALDDATGPRFCNAVLTAGIFFLYLNETDTEYHVPIDEVAKHFDQGDLRPWIRSLTDQLDQPKKRRK
jgi:hypothetical protein